MDILTAKKIERENIKEAIKRWPRFFEGDFFVDNKSFLEKYGIFIPDKKNLPQGYLKLWPQDFIVEEISFDGEKQTIFPDKFLSKEKQFLYEDPVVWTTLVKCNLSSVEVAEELSRKLKLEPEALKMAGIKDKRAITSQLISIKGKNLAEKISEIKSIYFFFKNTFSEKREIKVGMLKGNQFTLLVRTPPDFKKDDFLKKLEKIKKEGFYNFYYLQRLGLPRLISQNIGLNILKGDYEKAIKTMFCQSGEREIPYFRNIRQEAERVWGDWEKVAEILELFPFTFQIEREMTEHLIENPSDFKGTLNKIYKHTQFWLGSFYSFLFNKKISAYLKEKKEPPKFIPFGFLSDKKSWLFYEDLLKEEEILSIDSAKNNLKPFPLISFRHMERNTKERVEILNYKIIKEGVILNFNLPRGCYVDAFLSHLFNLVSGNLPKKFSNLPIDTKANLNQLSLEPILNKFTEVISSPAWQQLWGIYQ